MRKSGKIMWDFMPGTIVGLVTAMVLCVGESGAAISVGGGTVDQLVTAEDCDVVSCDSVSSFTSTSTTVTGCSSNGVDVCFRAATKSSIIGSSITYTYHKIRTCTRPGVAVCSAQFTNYSKYKCPDGSLDSYNFCTCVGANGDCVTDDDCSTDWGNTVGDFTLRNGYETRNQGYCQNNCSCRDYKIITYRCASTHYGTANCQFQGTETNPDGDITQPGGMVCSGCTECPENGTCTAGNGTTPSCNADYYLYSVVDDDDVESHLCGRCPAIIDSATGRQIYTNSILSTLAYGKSSAGSTDISRCYWGTGTYYDAAGTIKINSGTSYTTCGYSD